MTELRFELKRELSIPPILFPDELLRVFLRPRTWLRVELRREFCDPKMLF